MSMAPTTSPPGWLALAALLLGLAMPGCGGQTAGGDGIGVIPGDPGWQPVQPPDEGVCIGVKPGPEAWALSEAIAEAAAEAAAAAEPDVTIGRDDTAQAADAGAQAADAGGEATDEDATTGGFDFPALPDLPDEEAADPCSPDYTVPGDCIGAQAPAFAAYDFQPQSCGYGATYGLDIFEGRVTFVALLASW
ncbi:MAG: hypothetical protein QF464_12800 [Myxococcota bacterium]|nr:hypothetical protein [Myxococcota bacterium]